MRDMMAQQYSSNNRGGHRSGQQHTPLNVADIRFEGEDAKLDPELFNEIANRTAKTIADCQPSRNKPTQLRRFYDEIVMWDEKVRQNPERFDEYLPFIRMLNAKVAYAEGRKLVDRNFVELVSHCVSQVTTPEHMRTLKFFFEAFMGFHKLYGEGKNR
jgi:CRISPR-associated protein Csm2